MYRQSIRLLSVCSLHHWLKEGVVVVQVREKGRLILFLRCDDEGDTDTTPCHHQKMEDDNNPGDVLLGGPSNNNETTTTPATDAAGVFFFFF